MEGTAPQGIIPLPLDASAISHNASQNPQKPPLLPISKLMSALALANPASHPQVFVFVILLSHLRVALELVC